jgi:hypothetical protein
VDVDLTLDAVRTLRSQGETESARLLLRALAEQSPRDVTVRMALADVARADGHVDQAARWGLAIPGWTTEHERETFSRVLDHVSTMSRVRRYLRLGPREPLPVDLVPLLPEHLLDRGPSDEDGREPRAPFFPLPIALLAPVTGLLSLVARHDPSGVVPALATAASVCLVLAALVWAVAALVRRRPGPAAFAVALAAAAAVRVVRLATLA